MKLTVLTLNIEGDKHLPEVTRLIRDTKPDVVCLQEVFETDYKQLTKDVQLQGKFLPMMYVDVPGKLEFQKKGVFGVAILSRVPGTFGEAYYIKRRQKELPLYHGRPNAGYRALVWLSIDKGLPAEERATPARQSLTLQASAGGSRERTVHAAGEWQAKADLVIATTHFTWSKGGRATNKQRKELKTLIRLLDAVKPDILCGDFNAPRGGEIWSILSKHLVDNIPPEITSTIDPTLHYTKGLYIVVDGFFTSPSSRVRVESLKLVSGVSDHQAIVATITY